MPSFHPDRWLISVEVTAGHRLSSEDWFEFGRSIGGACTGGGSGGTVPTAQHTISFVFEPELADPNGAADALIATAAGRRPYSGLNIVPVARHSERFSDAYPASVS